VLVSHHWELFGELQGMRKERQKSACCGQRRRIVSVSGLAVAVSSTPKVICCSYEGGVDGEGGRGESDGGGGGGARAPIQIWGPTQSSLTGIWAKPVCMRLRR